MRNKKGFTLIELMVVVLIVAVLAAVLVPLMTARLESARWSEGKAGVGTIATAVRARFAEEGQDFAPSANVLKYINESDLYGKFFQRSNYTFFETPALVPGFGPDTQGYPVTFIIRVSRPTGPSPDGKTYTWKVAWWQMDETGAWTKSP